MNKRIEGYEAEYHNELHNNFKNNQYYEVRARLAKQKYFKNIPENAKILEFGCGLGQNIFLLKNTYGYDISKYALDFCAKKGIKTIKSIEEIPNNSFDIIFSSHALEHIETPLEILKLLKTKLKPGGKLILVLPAERQKKVPLEPDKNQHIFAWNFRTINNLINRAGYKVIINRYESGKGYEKLSLFSKLNFSLYLLLTKFVALLFKSKELVIEAIKE